MLHHGRMQTHTGNSGMEHYGAVILAAGFSRRLPGENKLLKYYRGQPLLSHALAAAQALGLADAVVVTRPDMPAVEEIAATAGLRCVANPDAAEGMGSSIAAGVSALCPDIVGIFVALGDMPHVTAEDYRALAKAHVQHTAHICVPVWDGRRGHPVLFGADYRNVLARLSGDTGARAVLADHAARVVAVPAASSGILTDLDTAEDFALEQPHTPSPALQRRKQT